MGAMASKITDVSIVCSSGCSWADQRKHQSSASLAFVRGIQRWPMNSLHKGPVTRKMFRFGGFIRHIDTATKWPPLSDDISKLSFFFVNCFAFIQFPMKFASNVPVNNKPALGQIMYWHGTGESHYLKQLWLNLLTYIWVTGPRIVISI